MTVTDLLLAACALGVAIFLARGAHPVVAGLLMLSALAVSAILFLPTAVVTGWVGMDRVHYLYHLARSTTPLDSSDWLHLILFTWLGLLIWLARPNLRNWRGIALVTVLAVGAELAQWLADGREPGVGDATLNVVGGLVGVLLAHVLGLIAARIRGRTGT